MRVFQTVCRASARLGGAASTRTSTTTTPRLPLQQRATTFTAPALATTLNSGRRPSALTSNSNFDPNICQVRAASTTSRSNQATGWRCAKHKEMCPACTRRMQRLASVSLHQNAADRGQANAAVEMPARKSHLDVMVERGAYDERVIGRVTCSTVGDVSVIEDGKNVEVTWEDGRVSRYNTLWLRHLCFCEVCRFEGSGQPRMALDLIPSDLKVESAVDDGAGSLVVHWKGEKDHTGVYPLKWLRSHCYAPETVQEKRDAIQMNFSTDTSIPRVSFEEVMGSREGVLKWMRILNQRGLALVEGLPLEPGMGRTVCERISRGVLPTLYGFIEDIHSRPMPINAGYSTDGLKLHQDLVFYSNPPGMQGLFCLKFDAGIEGGHSTFCDMFHIAETFRERNPKDFDVLATVPCTIDTKHYSRDFPVHMNVKEPMFKLNDHGDLIGVRYQPHHLAPLQVKEEMIEPFYAAYKKFYILTNNWPHMFHHRLQPGEMITYNNRRMAHGRTAYTQYQGQERHLQGCYIDVSEFKSAMQSLENMVGDGRPVHRVGDYDYM